MKLEKRLYKNDPRTAKAAGEVIPRAQAVVGFEVTHDFPTIGRRTMLVSARRMVQEDKEDEAAVLFLMFNDVTKERKAAADNDLLLAEIRHRIKNALAIVHAIAFQTEAEGKSGIEYRDAFLGRLDAFLSSKELVASAADAELRLSAIVDDALRVVNPRQIHIQPSPAVDVDVSRVRPLRMMLHELMTNALKYGALSSSNGVVHFSWGVTGDGKDQTLQLDWREEGGPPVTPPEHLAPKRAPELAEGPRNRVSTQKGYSLR